MNRSLRLLAVCRVSCAVNGICASRCVEVGWCFVQVGDLGRGRRRVLESF
jgi:hypothetical protein